MIALRLLGTLLAAVLASAIGLAAGLVIGHLVTGWIGVPDADGERALVSGLLFGLPMLVAGFDLGSRLADRRRRTRLLRWAAACGTALAAPRRLRPAPAG